MEGQIKPHIYMPTTQLFLDQVFPSNPQGADDKNAHLIFLCKCGEPPYVKSNRQRQILGSRRDVGYDAWKSTGLVFCRSTEGSMDSQGSSHLRNRQHGDLG